MTMKTFLFSVLALVASAEIQLFEYTHPTHEIQVNYMVAVSEQIMMRQRWDRNFDGTSCPETSVLICTKEGGCKPPEPPVDPPDVCDLETHQDDPDCQPGGTCEETGTCPIPICEVPVHLRVVQDGVELCLPDFCKQAENHDDPKCKHVDICDLKFYAENLEKCKELPPDEEKCEKYPDLCVISCDLTGDYSPCTYEICDTYPFLPHCNELPPPPHPCTDENDPSVAVVCCTGPDCDTQEEKCQWAWKIGNQSTQVGNPIFSDKTKMDSNGNVFLECLNEVDVVQKKDILFECFKEGVEIGAEWSMTTKDKITEVIEANKGDMNLDQMEIGDTTGSASFSEEKREQLEF